MEIELRTQLKGKMPCVASDVKTPLKVSAFEKYAIDVEPIPLRLKKNREMHLHYIKRLKKNVETLREIVKDAKVERPLDISLAFAAVTLKHSQEAEKASNFVSIDSQCETSTHDTPPQVEYHKINSTNASRIPSTGVKGTSAASESKPRSNTKKDRTSPARSALKQVEAHSRMNKSNEKQENRVDSSISSKRTVIIGSRDQCPLTRITKPKALPVKQWKPTGRLIPLDGQCPLVRPPAPTNSPNPVASNLVYSNQTDPNCNRGSNISNSPFSPVGSNEVVQIIPLVIWTQACSKHMTGDRSRLRNFVKKFIGTGLGHNLFSVGQFCDSDLEVAFRKHRVLSETLMVSTLLKEVMA
ncbi:hypothetical protein Tco_0679458 [Tanacetum coccineum]|uniref:Integrase, catalytic region, zinc finger, CCHC-type, peptidase aspartic, catalytic n=1 Tax=Tanacetum coccineum TaxID=301880 RepID=A0ABQ4XHX7_9ASTR